jgi:hypothetical protein
MDTAACSYVKWIMGLTPTPHYNLENNSYTLTAHTDTCLTGVPLHYLGSVMTSVAVIGV